MKPICYGLSLLCAVGCGLNIWCVVTNQPSEFHLNVLAAVVCGVASLVILLAAYTIDK
jgi:hypothetical protein